MILTDELCDKLCAAAHEKSKEIGIDISFAISDENGLPRAYRRYGEALVLSITLVPERHIRQPLRNVRRKMWPLVPWRAVHSWQSRRMIPESH